MISLIQAAIMSIVYFNHREYGIVCDWLNADVNVGENIKIPTVWIPRDVQTGSESYVLTGEARSGKTTILLNDPGLLIINVEDVMVPFMDDVSDAVIFLAGLTDQEEIVLRLYDEGKLRVALDNFDCTIGTENTMAWGKLLLESNLQQVVFCTTLNDLFAYYAEIPSLWLTPFDEVFYEELTTQVGEIFGEKNKILVIMYRLHEHKCKVTFDVPKTSLSEWITAGLHSEWLYEN